jgi:hypothetical protein
MITAEFSIVGYRQNGLQIKSYQQYLVVGQVKKPPLVDTRGEQPFRLM